MTSNNHANGQWFLPPVRETSRRPCLAAAVSPAVLPLFLTFNVLRPAVADFSVKVQTDHHFPQLTLQNGTPQRY